MTQLADPTSVSTEIDVEATPEHAFRVFTEGIGTWWDTDKHILAAPLDEMVFEPFVGGHIIDRGTDGSECRWARVLVYEPPQRVVFSWDIGPTWQLETDPDNTSEVEVRFTAETPQRTRVELEHRHIDRHGPGWPAVADGIGNDAGWPLYLARYASLLGDGS